MAVLRLRAIAITLVAACYSPDAPDCTLTCTGDADCVSGQACTTDHLCAATSITRCGAHAMTDGNNATGSDAGMGSGSGSGSGSATYVTLTLHVDGNGSASTSNDQTCDSIGTMKDCPFQVVKSAPLTVTATPHVTKQFDKWTGGPCDNQPITCQTTPNGPIMIQAKFKN
ncbi:MAG TPA: hypothetical protein VFQ65_18055 [Kofleriaceae bacterium]|nr:hypothetical protein [Kofleriaceae bacterium]